MNIVRFLKSPESSQGKLQRYVMVLAFAFISLFIGDKLSALFVPITFYIYALSGLIGYGITGAAFGWLLHILFAQKAKIQLMILPIFMLIAGAIRSSYNFISDERVFHFNKWIGYIFTSKFGLYWFIFIPLGAYISITIIERRRK